MTKIRACRSKEEYVYEYQGETVYVLCELPRDHDGPHAAWTWEGCAMPRVEWHNKGTELVNLRSPDNQENSE